MYTDDNISLIYSQNAFQAKFVQKIKIQTFILNDISLKIFSFMR